MAREHAPAAAQASRIGTHSTSRAGLATASWLALALTLTASLGLRVIGLDHLPGVNGDEAVYGVHALSWLHGTALSELRTGTDLPMNAPYFGVVAALHAVLEPSVLTLRLAPLAHSLAVLLLAWLLFRKRGGLFASLFVVTLAVLPIHIGYARFAWDSAATPTMLLLTLAAASRLRPLWTCAAFAGALWVHPVNVLALPIACAPFVLQRWPRHPEGSLRAPGWRVCMLVLGALAGLSLLGLLLERSDALPTRVLMVLRAKLVSRALARLLDPAEALAFVGLHVDLLSGATIYRYIAGSLPSQAASWHRLTACCVLGAVLALGARRLWAAQRSQDLALLAGLLISGALAYVVGGPTVLRPSTERYGMFLTVPSCYVFAACLTALASDARRATAVRAGLAAIGALLIACFATYYIGALRAPDADRERAFRTGDIEPKRRALEAIRDMRDPQRTALLLAEDWWIYWPVRYLSERESNVRVTIPGRPWDLRFPSDFAPPPFDPKRMELYGVTWAGSAYDARLARHAQRTISIRGYQPGPILHVHRLPPPPPR